VVRYEGGYDGCSRKGEYLMETWMGMAVHSPRSGESGETEMQRQSHYSMSTLEVFVRVSRSTGVSLVRRRGGLTRARCTASRA